MASTEAAPADNPSVSNTSGETGDGLAYDLHCKYVVNLDKDMDLFEFYVTEHLRVSGVYWGLAAMAVLDAVDQMDKEKIVSFVVACQRENGGFGGNKRHDAHMLYTLSAVQILLMYDELSAINVDKCAEFVAGLQQPDGSFWGDKWGEVDSRFSYCAMQCLALLGKLDLIDMDKAVEFILRCQNFDGGFGCIPGAESHAGQIFTCVGALAIAGQVHKINADQLGWWLCERQCGAGGLNGRPEKKPDVCYSWWVVSSLSIIDRLHWIDGDSLSQFILSCEDREDGGFADAPGDIADVFHTFFGLAGLALLGHKSLAPIDPVYALPASLTKRLGLPGAHPGVPTKR